MKRTENASVMAWEKYGFGFWAGFSALSVVMVIAGTAMSVYGAWRLLTEGFDASPAILFAGGLMEIITSVFCLRLLPRWSEMVREARMGNERLKGVLGSSSVSQYIQADENRNRTLMESIERKQNDVGITLAKKIERSDQKTSVILEDLQRSLAAMTAKIAVMADPSELEKYRREAERLEKENRRLKEAAGAERDGKEPETEEMSLPQVAETEMQDAKAPEPEEDDSPLGFVSPEDEVAYDMQHEEDPDEDDDGPDYDEFNLDEALSDGSESSGSEPGIYW